MPIFDTTVEHKISVMEAEIKGLRTRDQRNMAHLLKVLAAQTAKIDAVHAHVVPQKKEVIAVKKPTSLDWRVKPKPADKPADKHPVHKPKHK